MDFTRKTRKLLSTSKDGRIRIRDFEQQFPCVAAQIRRDAISKCLEQWGLSRNVDEHAKARIVDPKLLTVIGRLAKRSIRNGSDYHAGLMHTYGYLFSLLVTRYGYKRDRWVAGDIERGLGIPPGVFSPSPPTGTLLTNVTRFLIRVSFSKSDYEEISGNVQEEDAIGSFSFENLSGQRIRERIKLADGRQIDLCSDLLEFTKKTKAHSALLVYFWNNGETKKLITCFPISSATHSELLAIGDQRNFPIRLQYNAVIDGVPAEPQIGSRRIGQLKL